MDEVERDRQLAEQLKEITRANYVPVRTADSAQRIAHALEYIAAQLHAIRTKLDQSQ